MDRAKNQSGVSLRTVVSGEILEVRRSNIRDKLEAPHYY